MSGTEESNGSFAERRRERGLDYTDPDLKPLPPTGRRVLRIPVVAGIAVSFAIVLGVGGSVALLFGWHPIPSTALVCSLHKRSHSFSGSPVTKSDNLQLATDCLKVTIFGREEMVGRFFCCAVSAPCSHHPPPEQAPPIAAPAEAAVE